QGIVRAVCLAFNCARQRVVNRLCRGDGCFRADLRFVRWIPPGLAQERVDQDSRICLCVVSTQSAKPISNKLALVRSQQLRADNSSAKLHNRGEEAPEFRRMGFISLKLRSYL